MPSDREPSKTTPIGETPTLPPESTEPRGEQVPDAAVTDAKTPAIAETPTLPVSATGSNGGAEEAMQLGPRQFGEYELLEEIARGGMGVVFKARQTTLNRIVALKMILAGRLAGNDDVQRFRSEAEAAAQLDHPGIVPIFEIGHCQGQHYFTMSYVEGQSLANRMAAGPLPPREAAELIRQVSLAMAYAHNRGVIHRDLKPANVILDANGQPKVTDFGLAKQTESDSNLTGTGQILGTPAYMPPEQAAGKSEEIGPLADVYSLGAILYALLAGRPPFQAANPIDTLRQVVDRDPVSLTQLVPTTPRDLETICAKCLSKDSGKRYSSAQMLADDLERYLADEPILARPASRFERAAKWASKQPVIAATLLTLPAWLLGEPKLGVGLLALIAGFFVPFCFRWQRLLLIFGSVLVLTIPVSGISLIVTQFDRDAAGSTAQLVTIGMLSAAAPIGATVFVFLYDCFGWMAESRRTSTRWFLSLTAIASLLCIVGFLLYLRQTSAQFSGIANQFAAEIMSLANLQQGVAVNQSSNVPAELIARARIVLWIPVYTGVVWLNLVLGAALARAVRRFVFAHVSRPPGVSRSTPPQRIKAVDGELARWAAILAAVIFAILPYAAASLVGIYNVDVMNRFATDNPLDSILLLVGATWLAAYHVASEGGFKWTTGAIVVALAYFGYQTADAINTHRRDLGLLSVEERARSSDAILIGQLEGHTGPVKWIDQNPAGTLAVSASGWPKGDRTIRVWDTRSRDLLWLRRIESDLAMTATFTSDGRNVVAGSRDGQVYVWDAETALELSHWQTVEDLQAITVLSDDRRCLVAGKRVQLCDINSGEVLVDYTGFSGRRLDVNVSRDEQRVASCGVGGDVIVWDLATGNIVSQMDGLGEMTESVALNHDGSSVCVGISSSNLPSPLVMMDVGKKEIQTVFHGHEADVNWVRYSPDDRFLVSASRDRTVRLWDAPSGQELGVLRAHHEWVWAAAFTSDGTGLLTGGGGIQYDTPGEDFNIRQWDLSRLLPESSRPSVVNLSQ